MNNKFSRQGFLIVIILISNAVYQNRIKTDVSTKCPVNLGQNKDEKALIYKNCVSCQTLDELTTCTQCQHSHNLVYNKIQKVYLCESCTIINENCLSCQAEKQVGEGLIKCTVCKEGYILKYNEKQGNSVCFKTIQNCLKYNKDNYKCEQYCLPSCQSCDSIDTCKTCKPSTPSRVGSQCSCPLGYYDNQQSTQCEKCAPQCQLCKGKADNCTICEISGYNVIIDPPKCLCDIPYQFTLVHEDGSTSCQRCPTGCIKCNSQYQCLECEENRVLDSNNVCMCRENYFSYESKCTLCYKYLSSCYHECPSFTKANEKKLLCIEVKNYEDEDEEEYVQIRKVKPVVIILVIILLLFFGIIIGVLSYLWIKRIWNKYLKKHFYKFEDQSQVSGRRNSISSPYQQAYNKQFQESRIKLDDNFNKSINIDPENKNNKSNLDTFVNTNMGTLHNNEVANQKIGVKDRVFVLDSSDLKTTEGL